VFKLEVGTLSWKRLAGTAFFAWATLAAATWVALDQLIFLPHPAGYADDKTYMKLALADGTRVTARWLPNPAARYTILYAHGNAEDLGDAAATLQTLHGLGFAVLGFEYPGYGTSEGRPSCAGATAAAVAAWTWLTRDQHVPPSRLIAHARSVGGGPTMELVAGPHPVAGLILESTFTTPKAMAWYGPLMPFERFESARHLAASRLPVLVMHGEDDQTIPFAHGQGLYAAATGPKAKLFWPLAGHNDLQDFAGPAWGQAIQAFAASLPPG
jgi:fermentation-respiration switch protein FrsA (DUF1100 family)